MRVEIVVIQGPAAHKRAEVFLDQPLIVGRGAEAGLCILDDLTISRSHLKIVLAPHQCELTSLSANRTFLNGAEVKTAVLAHGDEISLGQDTVLQVCVANEPGSFLAPTIPEIRLKPTFTELKCPSGLSRFEGSTEWFGPQLVMQRLLARGGVLAIVDYKRLEQETPASVTADDALFDWLPPEISRENSPVVFDAASADLVALVEQGWDHDALVVLISKNERGALIDHLRRALRFNSKGLPQPHAKGILGICWPGVLKDLLMQGSPEFVARLLLGIDAVLLEDTEASGGWLILAQPGFAQVLEELEIGRLQEADTKKAAKR